MFVQQFSTIEQLIRHNYTTTGLNTSLLHFILQHGHQDVFDECVRILLRTGRWKTPHYRRCSSADSTSTAISTNAEIPTDKGHPINATIPATWGFQDEAFADMVGLNCGYQPSTANYPLCVFLQNGNPYIIETLTIIRSNTIHTVDAFDSLLSNAPVRKLSQQLHEQTHYSQQLRDYALYSEAVCSILSNDHDDIAHWIRPHSEDDKQRITADFATYTEQDVLKTTRQRLVISIWSLPQPRLFALLLANRADILFTPSQLLLQLEKVQLRRLLSALVGLSRLITSLQDAMKQDPTGYASTTPDYSDELYNPISHKITFTSYQQQIDYLTQYYVKYQQCAALIWKFYPFHEMPGHIQICFLILFNYTDLLPQFLPSYLPSDCDTRSLLWDYQKDTAEGLVLVSRHSRQQQQQQGGDGDDSNGSSSDDILAPLAADLVVWAADNRRSVVEPISHTLYDTPPPAIIARSDTPIQIPPVFDPNKHVDRILSALQQEKEGKLGGKNTARGGTLESESVPSQSLASTNLRGKKLFFDTDDERTSADDDDDDDNDEDSDDENTSDVIPGQSVIPQTSSQESGAPHDDSDTHATTPHDDTQKQIVLETGGGDDSTETDAEGMAVPPGKQHLLDSTDDVLDDNKTSHSPPSSPHSTTVPHDGDGDGDTAPTSLTSSSLLRSCLQNPQKQKHSRRITFSDPIYVTDDAKPIIRKGKKKESQEDLIQHESLSAEFARRLGDFVRQSAIGFAVECNLTNVIDDILHHVDASLSLNHLMGGENIVALACSSAQVNGETLRYLLTKRARLLSNSRLSVEANAFYCTYLTQDWWFRSYRREKFEILHQHISKSTAYKPNIDFKDFINATFIRVLDRTLDLYSLKFMINYVFQSNERLAFKYDATRIADCVACIYHISRPLALPHIDYRDGIEDVASKERLVLLRHLVNESNAYLFDLDYNAERDAELNEPQALDGPSGGGASAPPRRRFLKMMQPYRSQRDKINDLLLPLIELRDIRALRYIFSLGIQPVSCWQTLLSLHHAWCDVRDVVEWVPADFKTHPENYQAIVKPSMSEYRSKWEIQSSEPNDDENVNHPTSSTNEPRHPNHTPGQISTTDQPESIPEESIQRPSVSISPPSPSDLSGFSNTNAVLNGSLTHAPTSRGEDDSHSVPSQHPPSPSVVEVNDEVQSHPSSHPAPEEEFADLPELIGFDDLQASLGEDSDIVLQHNELRSQIRQSKINAIREAMLTRTRIGSRSNGDGSDDDDHVGTNTEPLMGSVQNGEMTRRDTTTPPPELTASFTIDDLLDLDPDLQIVSCSSNMVPIFSPEFFQTKQTSPFLALLQLFLQYDNRFFEMSAHGPRNLSSLTCAGHYWPLLQSLYVTNTDTIAPPDIIGKYQGCLYIDQQSVPFMCDFDNIHRYRHPVPIIRSTEQVHGTIPRPEGTRIRAQQDQQRLDNPDIIDSIPLSYTPCFHLDYTHELRMCLLPQRHTNPITEYFSQQIFSFLLSNTLKEFLCIDLKERLRFLGLIRKSLVIHSFLPVAESRFYDGDMADIIPAIAQHASSVLQQSRKPRQYESPHTIKTFSRFDALLSLIRPKYPELLFLVSHANFQHISILLDWFNAFVSYGGDITTVLPLVNTTIVDYLANQFLNGTLRDSIHRIISHHHPHHHPSV